MYNVTDIIQYFFKIASKKSRSKSRKCKKSTKKVKKVLKMKGLPVLSNFEKIRKARLRISLSEKRSVLFMGFAT